MRVFSVTLVLPLMLKSLCLWSFCPSPLSPPPHTGNPSSFLPQIKSHLTRKSYWTPTSLPLLHVFTAPCTEHIYYVSMCVCSVCVCSYFIISSLTQQTGNVSGEKAIFCFAHHFIPAPVLCQEYIKSSIKKNGEKRIYFFSSFLPSSKCNYFSSHWRQFIDFQKGLCLPLRPECTRKKII